MSGQRWYEIACGSRSVHVLASSGEEARRRAEAEMVNLGVLPGPMHERWKRFVEATK